MNDLLDVKGLTPFFSSDYQINFGLSSLRNLGHIL